MLTGRLMGRRAKPADCLLGEEGRDEGKTGVCSGKRILRPMCNCVVIGLNLSRVHTRLCPLVPQRKMSWFLLLLATGSVLGSFGGSLRLSDSVHHRRSR